MEIWKPIQRFDSLVEVSNLGNVRTVDRVVKSKGGTRVVKGRLVKFRSHPWGYWWCEFMVNGTRYWDFVHRLVAEAFFGPCPEGHYVLHGDNDPRNNRVENLRYGTPAENCSDKLIHGTQPTGERIPWHKLKESQVVDIRCKRAAGAKLADIAAEYGVSEVYVWHICTGQKWPNAGGPIEGKVRKVNVLTNEQKGEVLRLRAEGWSIHRLALKFNTSNTQIHNLVRKHENQKSDAVE